MEYYCYVWAGAPSCYLEMLHKLQKWIWRTVGPSCATSLEPLADQRNVTTVGLIDITIGIIGISIGITLADVHLNWLNWFHSLIFKVLREVYLLL